MTSAGKNLNHLVFKSYLDYGILTSVTLYEIHDILVLLEKYCDDLIENKLYKKSNESELV